MNFICYIIAVIYCLPTLILAQVNGLPTSGILERIKKDSIQGTEPEEIFKFIMKFPLQEYDIVSVKSLLGFDKFYADRIPDYIKGDLRSGLFWEPHVSGCIKNYCKPGSIAVDIGSHIGSHVLTMSRLVGPHGKVIAFEPQPKIFRELVMNMALNGCENISFFWGAAGAEAGSIELDVLGVANEASVGLGHGGTGKFVRLIPLDSLGLTNVSLIKIDVEGMEDLVLAGARETILTNKPVILIEICGGQVPWAGPPEVRNEIFRRIKIVEDLGYTVVQLFNWDYIALPSGTPLKEKVTDYFY